MKTEVLVFSYLITVDYLNHLLMTEMDSMCRDFLCVNLLLV